MSESRLSISEERVLKILEAYGGDSRSWPPEEVETTLHCISRSPALQQARLDALRLDGLLGLGRDRAQVDMKQIDSLAARIVARLPAQATAGIRSRINLLPGWCLVFGGARRATALLCAAAVLAALAILLRPTVGTDDKLFNDFEQWVWQDITGQALTLDDQEPALDFMGLVELESTADGV